MTRPDPWPAASNADLTFIDGRGLVLRVWQRDGDIKLEYPMGAAQIAVLIRSLAGHLGAYHRAHDQGGDRGVGWLEQVRP